MESRFRIDASGTWFDRADLAWRMNEYDTFAVEQAIRVKEQLGEAEITALSVGPERVREMLRKALAMGCDRGIHMVDNQIHQREPYEVAGIIAEYGRGKDFDLVFTGMQSQDRGSGQLGVMLAEMLSISCVTTVIDFSCKDNRIVVKRELEGGIRAKIGMNMPVLITCQTGLNTPRYPTFPNIMKAKKKELQIIPVASSFPEKPMHKTTELYFPERGTGVVIEEESKEAAEQLLSILKTKLGIIQGPA